MISSSGIAKSGIWFLGMRWSSSAVSLSLVRIPYAPSVMGSLSKSFVAPCCIGTMKPCTAPLLPSGLTIWSTGGSVPDGMSTDRKKCLLSVNVGDCGFFLNGHMRPVYRLSSRSFGSRSPFSRAALHLSCIHKYCSGCFRITFSMARLIFCIML